jgi:ubiquinone/menaquinone biosynthesis C-methylase UbiE
MKAAVIGKGSSWGGVAHWYEQHLESAGTYHETVVLPGVLRLLAPKKGEKVLDIACGEGYFTRAYAKVGTRTYGADISSELIHAARSKAKDVTYFTSAAEDLSFADDELYDAASLILAIQNIKGLLRFAFHTNRVGDMTIRQRRSIVGWIST